MRVEDFYSKIKSIADKLASATSLIIEKGLILTILNGLRLGYCDIATLITGSYMD